jgi:hypothetical protein
MTWSAIGSKVSLAGIKLWLLQQPQHGLACDYAALFST